MKCIPSVIVEAKDGALPMVVRSEIQTPNSIVGQKQVVQPQGHWQIGKTTLVRQCFREYQYTQFH